MTVRRSACATAVLCVAAFGAVRLVPTGMRDNPGVNPANTIEAKLEVPAHIRVILAKACGNCHSYETVWPWYARIAPVSWMVADDVERARQAMNLSDWAVRAGRKPRTAMATLMAACAGVESSRMPPFGYRLLHPEARLDSEETRAFCDWTAEQVGHFRGQLKQQLRDAGRN